MTKPGATAGGGGDAEALRCPGCGKPLDMHTRVGGAGVPTPGDLSVCAYCGALGQFNAAGGIDLLGGLPADLGEETKLLVLRAQELIRSRMTPNEIAEKNMRLRGGEKPAGEGAARAAGYAQTAEATLEALRLWLEITPRPIPRFAFPHDEVAIIVSLADAGHRFARNDAAHAIVEMLCGLKAELGLGDHPTAMMLRVCLKECGVPTETATLTELGFEPRGGGGGLQ